MKRKSVQIGIGIVGGILLGFLTGCDTPSATIPIGAKIVFKSDAEAASFRAATLIDVTHLSPFVTVDKELEVRVK